MLGLKAIDVFPDEMALNQSAAGLHQLLDILGLAGVKILDCDEMAKKLLYRICGCLSRSVLISKSRKQNL